MDVASQAIAAMKKRFRILRGWRIYVSRNQNYSGWAGINEKTKKAIIYPWRPVEDTPVDFALHELLHVSLRQLLSMDRREMKKLRQAEEDLVQDICSILREAHG